MNDIQVTVDKFVFRVARECRYSNADVWAKHVGQRVRIGLTDYLQQKLGDAAFVNLKIVGTALGANEELGALETIKVDVGIPTPVAGKITTVNEALGAHPELVNQDPYGIGWLVEIEPNVWADYETLLDAETYSPQMKTRAELERQQ